MKNKRKEILMVSDRQAQKIEEKKLADLKGKKDSSQREVGGMTYTSKQTLKPIKSIFIRG
jgi:hypothetical protein